MLITYVITTILLAFIIYGDICYYKSDNIIYGYYGNILFKYYYLIQIIWYSSFILLYMVLFIYILCITRKMYVDKTWLHIVKITNNIFLLNFITKFIYGSCIIILSRSDKNSYIIPDYYNFIILEIVSYFIVSFVIMKINFCIDMIL